MLQLNGNRKIHGFTLIEIIVSMAVAAIILSFAVPNLYSGMEGMRFDYCKKKLLQDLKENKSFAMERNSNSIYMHFIKAKDSSDYGGYYSYYFNADGSKSMVNSADFPFYIYISAAESSFKDGEIRFDADGSVYTACSVVIVNSKKGLKSKITLTPGYSRIMPVSGVVEVRRKT